MKPVVSSLVALAIAIAAPVAMASPEKPAKHVVHKAKKEKKASPIVHVNHVVREKKHVEGHKGEPKIETGVTVVPASLTTKPKLTPAKMTTPPSPAKAKGGHEKGAKKSPAKKADDGAKDGQPERDEDFAELVARIRGKSGKHANKGCSKEPVELARGSESETITLVTCDGQPAPLAIEKVSILIRPGSAVRPITPIEELAKKKGAELAKGIKRVDPKLLERLEAIAEHFAKDAPPKFDIVSGYRPTSTGSLHASGKAIDFKLEGVKNEDVVSFCKTLNDTGCGFYPNAGFVHIDVRELGTGHVSWIDASNPGEAPRYVTQWPEPAGSGSATTTKAPEGVENASAKHEEKPAEPPPDADAAKRAPKDPATELEPLP
ncbi:MAG TPA: DUF882 domain-containing protein [Labilithrix sp.]